MVTALGAPVGHWRAVRAEYAQVGAPDEAVLMGGREVVRFLHDEVIPALRAVAQGRGVDDEQVRALVERVAIRFDAPSRAGEGAGRGPLSLVERLAALELTGARVSVSGHCPHLEPGLVEAIAGAAAEAVRNVARHSGTNHAHIEVRPLGAGVRVSIIDHGRGIQAGARVSTGLSESVFGCMAEVGGRARVRSGADGTTVDLSWEPESSHERIGDARDQQLRSHVRASAAAERPGAEHAGLRRMRARILPFLNAILAGQMDLDDPAVRRRAAQLETEVREELRFGCRTDALTAQIARARRAGWQLDVRLTPQDRAAIAARAGALLAALGDGPDDSGPVYLSAFDEVAIVAHNPPPAKVRQWRARADVHLEEGDRWCRLTVPASG
ncbi:MAG: hypothetical protein Q4F67_14040 [Propionibacteriaceae bacterium]|nr:hypothetical protein [Propionibacteriaceae bacterium]